MRGGRRHTVEAEPFLPWPADFLQERLTEINLLACLLPFFSGGSMSNVFVYFYPAILDCLVVSHIFIFFHPLHGRKCKRECNR